MNTFFLVNTKTGELKGELYGSYMDAFTEWFDEVVGNQDIQILSAKA